MKKILIDIHTGKDGNFSQRSVLGTFGFIGHMGISAYGAYITPEDIVGILTVNVGLIGFMIGAKTWQNFQESKLTNTNG